jgi:diazepam-binding inhibitor (GABA receptor modulator, acyl-CoA-binding protein)
MPDLKTQFENAFTASKELTSKPDNATLLKLYSLYKQATVGDATGDRPDFDFVGAAKFDAWDGLQGMSRDDAMQGYVTLIATLKA